jgi:hypothetical protein
MARMIASTSHLTCPVIVLTELDHRVRWLGGTDRVRRVDGGGDDAAPLGSIGRTPGGRAGTTTATGPLPVVKRNRQAAMWNRIRARSASQATRSGLSEEVVVGG